MKQRVVQMEDTVKEHAASLQTLQSKVCELEYKVDDAENRKRRNNLRIVGLPEGEDFVEDLLHSLLPEAQFSSNYAMERAHRIPPTPGPVGSPPHTLIFRLLNFQDRMRSSGLHEGSVN